MVKKEVVYKALPGAANIPQAPAKIDIPTYPDKGVSYAGYAKLLLSGNQFKLIPQKTFDFNGAVITGAGGTAWNWSMPDKSAEQIYYITSISLSANLTNATRLGIVRGNSTLYSAMFPVGITERNITLAIPIEVKEANIYVTSSVGTAAGDQIVINLYGWIE